MRAQTLSSALPHCLTAIAPRAAARPRETAAGGGAVTSPEKNRSVHGRERARVLLALPETEDRQIHALVEAGRECEWDLLDIVMTRGHIPSDLPPCGAMVDCFPTQSMAKRLRRLNIPIVRLGQRLHPRDGELPAVVPDYAAAGQLAASHFAERGFKQVAYEATSPQLDNRPLWQGFQAATRELGLSCERLRMKGKPPAQPVTRASAAEHERRAARVGDWLVSIRKPVGILSHSASMLCTICLRVGLVVPDDVALLGVGNHMVPCELAPVPLSSIDTAAEEQAREAVRLLHRLMKGEVSPRQPIMIPPRGIVTRRSTDFLAVANPLVAQAMRFMWDNLDLDLSVAEVAEHFGVSIRSLQRAFRNHLGRGVIAELRRRRLQELRRLLRTTDMPVADLAARVGFRTLVHLHKCFRDAYGVTPRQYRLQRRGA